MDGGKFTQHNAQVIIAISHYYNVKADNYSIELKRKQTNESLNKYDESTKPAETEYKVTKPKNHQINFSNSYWQTDESNTNFFWNAFYDGRLFKLTNVPNASKLIWPFIHVITMRDHSRKRHDLYCYLWYNGKMEVVNATEEMIWFDVKEQVEFIEKTTRYVPYMVHCRVANTSNVPKYVSLSNYQHYSNSSLRNLFHISTSPILANRTDFAVCVKALDFDRDISAWLMEWIEIQRSLGASKIFFYVFSIEAATEKLLNYYKEQGIVDMKEATLAGDQPNEKANRTKYLKDSPSTVKRLNELVVLNDCYFRAIRLYKWVAIVDIDEVLVPSKFKTWGEMLPAVQSRNFYNESGKRVMKNCAAYSFQNAFFLDQFLNANINNTPAELHTLQHTNRSTRLSPARFSMKSLFNTDSVLLVHNHNPLKVFPYIWNWCEVPPSLGKNHHYRHNCPRDFKNKTRCDMSYLNATEDKTMWRYAKELQKRINKVKEDIGIS